MIDKQIDIDESLMLTFRRVLRFERLRNYIAPRDLHKNSFQEAITEQKYHRRTGFQALTHVQDAKKSKVLMSQST